MAVLSPAICVVGSSNIDLTFRTSRLPRPGETLSGQAFRLGYGGKGANQAVMAARLGARVIVITKVVARNCTERHGTYLYCVELMEYIESRNLSGRLLFRHSWYLTLLNGVQEVA